MPKPPHDSQAPAYPSIAFVMLLTPVRLGPRLEDGTIHPTRREQQGFALYDANRFLLITYTDSNTGKVYKRYVPWAQVGYWVDDEAYL